MKPNYYAVISAEVRYSDITPNAKLLYAEITAFCNMNGECFASNRYFANLYGKSKTTISNWIRELKTNNFIEVSYTYKKGTKEIDKRYIKILNGGVKENNKGGIKENFKDNNTSNNITSINNIYIKEKFISEVNSFKYEDDLKEEFIDYWCEGKKQMRWQKQPTFDISLRLKRWKKTQKNWNGSKKATMSKIDMHLQSQKKAEELLKKLHNDKGTK
jgi:hypothetical protein